MQQKAGGDPKAFQIHLRFLKKIYKLIILGWGVLVKEIALYKIEFFPK